MDHSRQSEGAATQLPTEWQTWHRTRPAAVTTYFVDVSSGRPIGPRACSFWVEMPISAPKPNSPPSVNRVDAFTITAAASPPDTNRRAALTDSLTIASVCPEP